MQRTTLLCLCQKSQEKLLFSIYMNQVDPVYLLDSYAVSQDCLVKHQLDSYNQYVHQRIPAIIQQFNPYRVQAGDVQVLVYVGGEDGTKLRFLRPMVTYGHGQEQQGGKKRTQRKLEPEQRKERAMTPQDARLTYSSYTFELRAEVLVRCTREGVEPVTRVFPDVHVASVPIMVRSDMCVLAGAAPERARELGECPHDPGGYFVIDGKEKVMVAQEKIRDHRLFTVRDAAGDVVRVEIRCTSEEDRLFPKLHVFQVYAKGRLRVAAPNTRRGEGESGDNARGLVPVSVMFRALGVETDRDIVRVLFPEAQEEPDGSLRLPPGAARLGHALRVCLTDGAQVHTQEQALAYLAPLSMLGTQEHAMHGLLNDFVPHAGKDFGSKALVFADMVRTVMEMVVTRANVDRDSMVSKRLDVAGFLLTYVTRDFVNRWRLAAMSAITQQCVEGGGSLENIVNEDNLTRIFSPDYIDRELMANFKQNKKWAIRNSSNVDDQEAIVQDLSRVSLLATVSHLRRVNTPVDRTSRIREPHYLHPTHWGVLCLAETPDGANVGLLKHLAMTACITHDLGNSAVYSVLTEQCGMTPLERAFRQRFTHMYWMDAKVTLNNVWVGTLPIADTSAVARYLRLLRRSGRLGLMTSISLDAARKTLDIGTEQGRAARPLLVVEDGRLLWQDKVTAQLAARIWQDWWLCAHPKGRQGVTFGLDTPSGLAGHGPRAFRNEQVLAQLQAEMCVVEFLDVEEVQTSALIALTPSDIGARTTHCEIHPSVIMGWVSACLPFCHHIPGPRNLNACGNSKQAIGVYATSFRRRLDTEAYVMCYPQRPLVRTTPVRSCAALQLPHGTNLLVLLAPFSGYNQEDALVVNRAAIERGAVSLTMYATMTAAEEKHKRFAVAPAAAAEDKLDFSSIGQDGVMVVGSRVYDRSVLFNMQTDKGADASVLADISIGGRVDRVNHFVDPQTGLRKSSVVIRQFRQLQIGDKQATRYYQKGVLGMLLDECDMPFSMQDGVVPDLIMNTLAFPSRATVGQIIESVLGVHCCKDSPISIVPLEHVPALGDGDRTFVSPVSGAAFAEPGLLGVVHVLRLKQQVADKVAFRSHGPVDKTTNQPLRGRTKDGGMRQGEMEMAALVTHGMSCFAKETLMDKSDGQLVQHGDQDDPGVFPTSARSSRCFAVPRSFAALVHEVTAMGVGMDVLPV